MDLQDLAEAVEQIRRNRGERIDQDEHVNYRDLAQELKHMKRSRGDRGEQDGRIDLRDLAEAVEQLKGGSRGTRHPLGRSKTERRIAPQYDDEWEIGYNPSKRGPYY